MVVNDLFEARAIEYKLQKIINDTDPHSYFIEIFGNTTEAKNLTNKIAEICKPTSRRKNDRDSDRPGQRLVNLVQREDNVAHWVEFVNHEQKRAGSVWTDKALKNLPDKLTTWYESLDNDINTNQDPILRALKEELSNIFNGLIHTEFRRIGLRVFRTMLWRLRGGEKA